MKRILILGGARSGKSAYAERLAAECGQEVVYIATAQPGDSEMAARIAAHRQQRNLSWITVEEPIALGAAVHRLSRSGRVVLVDCLTLWLSNLLFYEGTAYPEIGAVTPPPLFFEQREGLLTALDGSAGNLILVSNEIGLGIVPQGAVSRWFVDEVGRLNQVVAARCDKVVLMTAGLPLTLKDG